MSAEAKRGRPSQSKSWDLILRHSFRANYLEDADIHALMFICGDHLTEIINKALKEFVLNNNLPTNDQEFRSKLYLTAVTQINANREKPNAHQVLESMNELEILDKIRQLAGSNIQSTPRTKTRTPPVATIAAVNVSQSAQVTPIQPQQSAPLAAKAVIVESKSRLPPPVMDFGPELDEDALMGVTVAEKPPSLKDRWLQKHNY